MKDDQSCVIYGAGGHGRVVADAAIAAGHRVLGFIDDNIPEGSVILAKPDLELRVLGKPACIKTYPRESIAIGLGIGSNEVRRRCSEWVSGRGFALISIIHPSAIVSPFAVLGNGTVVMALAVVNPAARIGRGVIVNTGAIVEHDCLVGNFAHVSPNASLAGAARLGTLSHVGTGAVVLPEIVVGDRCTIGAGAVVIRDVGNDQVVVGVPAKPRLTGPG